MIQPSIPVSLYILYIVYVGLYIDKNLGDELTFFPSAPAA
jgi:hypothetical protein